MRVVIDTHVFVGACIGAGACNAVVKLCLGRRALPLLGAAFLAEYEAVLSRNDLFSASRLNLDERSELLDIFVAQCEWTQVYFLWRPNLADEADNHLIELAVAGGADIVVTRNLRDLRSPQLLFPALKVMTPEDFLKEF